MRGVRWLVNEGDGNVGDNGGDDRKVSDIDGDDMKVSDIGNGDMKVSDIDDGDMKVSDIDKDHNTQVSAIDKSNTQVSDIDINDNTQVLSPPNNNTQVPSLPTNHIQTNDTSPFLDASNLLTLEHTSPVKDLAWHPKCALSPALTQRRLRLRQRQRRLLLARHHPPAQQGPLADPRVETQGTRAARTLQSCRTAASLRRHAD